MKKSIISILLAASAVLLVSCASTRAFVEGTNDFDIVKMDVSKRNVTLGEYLLNFSRVKDNSVGVTVGDFSLGNTSVTQSGVFYKNNAFLYDIYLSKNGTDLDIGNNGGVNSLAKEIKITQNNVQVSTDFFDIEDVKTTLNSKGVVVNTYNNLGIAMYYKGKLYCLLDFKTNEISYDSNFPLAITEEEKDAMYAYFLTYYYYTQMFETGNNRTLLDGGFSFNFDLSN